MSLVLRHPQYASDRSCIGIGRYKLLAAASRTNLEFDPVSGRSHTLVAATTVIAKMNAALITSAREISFAVL